MNPEEFEKLVAKHYQSLGFVTETTPKNRDFGVDIFATKSGKKTAIQVKMYESRKVNYKDIMYLFAASKLFSCSHSTMVSLGQVCKDAKKVARKLNVKVLENFKDEQVFHRSTKNAASKSRTEIKSNSNFYRVWEDYIFPLQNKQVRTITGKSNIIEKVNWDGITRISSNGRSSLVEIEIFRWAYEQLIKRGKLTRNEINDHYTKRGSAIVFAVLKTLPFVQLNLKPATLLYIPPQ